MIVNTQWHVVRNATIIAILFLLGMFLPTWLDVDMIQWGFGVTFLSFFAFIVCLITIILFRKRAKILDYILEGGALVEWTVEDSLWDAFIQTNLEAQQSRNKVMFYVVAVIAAGMGILLSVLFQDALFLLICLGIILIVALPAFLMPFWYRNKLHTNNHVFIGKEGVYCGGLFNNWNAFNVKLDSISLNRKTKPVLLPMPFGFPFLLKTYSMRRTLLPF